MHCDTEKPLVSKEIIDDMWREAFNARKSCWLKVMSNSMFPLIKTNDYVFLEYINPSLINSGDIVTYLYKPGFLISHRIIGSVISNNHTYFLEKPDNGIFSSTISPELILGKITKIKKNNKVYILNSGAINILNKALSFHSKIVFLLSQELLSKSSTNKNRNLTSFMILYMLNFISTLPGRVFSIIGRFFK